MKRLRVLCHFAKLRTTLAKYFFILTSYRTSSCDFSDEYFATATHTRK